MFSLQNYKKSGKHQIVAPPADIKTALTLSQFQIEAAYQKPGRMNKSKQEPAMAAIPVCFCIYSLRRQASVLTGLSDGRSPQVVSVIRITLAGSKPMRLQFCPNMENADT